MNTILRKQFLSHVAQTSPSPMLVEVARAEGSFFYTPEGKRYYDLVAGVSVSNVGHANPAVVRAVQEQAARYMHVMVYGELVESPQVEYAARIASLLPGALESVYFVNSGAEAVEGALKLAKRFTGRTEMISMRRAYHGSTHGAMSMMGAPEGEEWKEPFRPLLPDVQAIEFNDFGALQRITRRTACVLAEPVQGEAGVRLPQPGYLEALRRRCDEVGALLVFDEIQTGLGRTGAMFASLRYGVTPDIVCLAKAFGGGIASGFRLAARDHGYAAARSGAGAHHHLRRPSGLLRRGACGAELPARKPHRRDRRGEGRPLRGAARGPSRRAGDPTFGAAAGRRAGRLGEALPDHGALQAGGHPERLVPLLRHGLPHLAAADHLRRGGARKRGAHPRMPRPADLIIMTVCYLWKTTNTKYLRYRLMILSLGILMQQ